MPDQPERPVTGAGCLLRTYWMLAGNLLTAFTAIVILEQERDAYTYRDILYWAAAASIVLTRYLDIRFATGQTASGAPATMQDWERHAMIVGAISLLAWIACHLALSTRG